MSWNFNLRLNQIQEEVNQIVAGTVTNPLTSTLNCNSNNIVNATNITATTGQNLSLNTSGSNSVTINAPVSIPNHPLTITNNTTGDSMVVSDTTGDTSVFRIDASGNVGVKVNTATPLTADFTVTGNEVVTGNITCNQLNYTTLNPPISGGVTQLTAGSGISVSTPTGNVTVSNTGVTQLTAGTGISVSASTGNVTITNTGGSVPTSELSYCGLAANEPTELAPGASGDINLTFSSYIQNEIDNGTPLTPNKVWLVDLSPYIVLWNNEPNYTQVDTITYAWVDGVNTYPLATPSPYTQYISPDAPLQFYPPGMFRTGSLGQVILPVNILHSLGFKGSLTQLRITNNATGAGVDIITGAFPVAIYCISFPNGFQYP
jgi:hypothetical protein